MRKLSKAFIARKARQFFGCRTDKASGLIALCKNTSEMDYRLRWLSEGSLQYHLLGGRYISPSGDEAEKELYREFDDHLNYEA